MRGVYLGADRLVLLAKEPRAGHVKTRLARELGDEVAVSLYTAFLTDLSESLPAADEWESLLAHAEVSLGPILEATFRGWEPLPQGTGSLGDRLARVASRCVAEGAERVVFVGGDAPTLAADDIRRAFDALRRRPVVLAPCPDGGYALVGLARGVTPEALFGAVRWSSEHTLADTVKAATAGGWLVELLPSVADVDVKDDLTALARTLEDRPGSAPATRRALGAAFSKVNAFP